MGKFVAYLKGLKLLRREQNQVHRPKRAKAEGTKETEREREGFVYFRSSYSRAFWFLTVDMS
jgi:hypothetical protein